MAHKGLPDSVPQSEFSEDFAQGMADRMAVSYFKYGLVSDAYPHKRDAIASMKQRLDLYINGGVINGAEVTKGNTEYLMDAANFLMIEFMYPSVAGAAFTSTDSNGSPGRVDTKGCVTHAQNKTEYVYKRNGD